MCKEDAPSVFYGLVDILFASSYDLRATEEERSPESGWTVGKLAATIGCSERFSALKDCVVSGFRRSLCFPLYRNYDFSMVCFQDVVRLLDGGNVAVLSTLLGLVPVLVEGDRYLYNTLYVEPYASWIQRVPSSHLTALSDALKKVLEDLTKDDLDLELTEIEQAAELVRREEEDEDKVAEVVQGLRGVQLERNGDDSDDSSSSESSSDSSSEDDSDDDDDSEDERECEEREKKSDVK